MRNLSSALSIVALVGLSAFTAIGCAAPTADDEIAADNAEVRGEATFSLRAVIPQLTWSFDTGAIDPAGALAIEVSATQGGFLGMGADRSATVSPLVMVGADAYGAGAPMLRIAKDLTVYLHFETTPRVELYCCLGSKNPTQDDDGVWHGEAANIADVDQSGYYVIGKLVGVRAEDLRHGTKLRADQLVLDDGMKLGFSRRIMRGDRQITIEANQVPELVSEMPEAAGDPNAAAQANNARK